MQMLKSEMIMDIFAIPETSILVLLVLLRVPLAIVWAVVLLHAVVVVLHVQKVVPDVRVVVLHAQKTAPVARAAALLVRKTVLDAQVAVLLVQKIAPVVPAALVAALPAHAAVRGVPAVVPGAVIVPATANVLAVEERVQQGVLPPARVLARQSA